MLTLPLFALKIELGSNITALKLEENILYVGTEEGEIFSLDVSKMDEKNSSIFLNEALIKLDKIENFYGLSEAKIYSIDVKDEALLILSEGNYGEKNLSFYRKNHLIQTQKLKIGGVNKAFFIDEKTILLSLIGSEIKLLDLNLKELNSFKFSHSSLNDLALSEDKTRLVAGFESGEVELFDLKKWKILQNYNQIHKDNIYQVDFKQGTILSCGTDRRIGVINEKEQKFLQKDFLIYACALSKNGKLAAFSDNDNNTIEIFNTDELKSVAKFTNENLMSEFIIFLDNKRFLISGYGTLILLRSLDEFI